MDKLRKTMIEMIRMNDDQNNGNKLTEFLLKDWKGAEQKLYSYINIKLVLSQIDYVRNKRMIETCRSQ